jgi:carbamate kinase
METFVVALGGNALLDFGEKPTFNVQHRNAVRAARGLVPLLKRENTGIVITHGNGPQVGDEFLRGEFAKKEIPILPLHALVAETQAFIGTMLELAIRQELLRINPNREVIMLLTHVTVNSKDGAFRNPSKPIGPFYTKAQLEAELKRESFSFVEVRNRYRKVVASPNPLKIIEIDAIKKSIKEGAVVIAGGGGGIPVVLSNGIYKGMDAVIDKDLTTERIASSLKADTLAILTNVDYVYMDYKSKTGPIKRIETSRLKPLLDKFEAGTIKPKLQACINFIEHGGNAAYIGNLFKLESILSNKSGTKITKGKIS